MSGKGLDMSSSHPALDEISVINRTQQVEQSFFSLQPSFRKHLVNNTMIMPDKGRGKSMRSKVKLIRKDQIRTGSSDRYAHKSPIKQDNHLRVSLTKDVTAELDYHLKVKKIQMWIRRHQALIRLERRIETRLKMKELSAG